MLLGQTYWPRSKYPTQTPSVRVFHSVSIPIFSQLQLVIVQHRLWNQKLLFTPFLAFFLFFFFFFSNFESFRNRQNSLVLFYFFFFRSASVLIASGQILPYLLEGLRPWEPSKGQVEKLLTLFLTKLKITFSINQTLHEASFNLQAPHLCVMILPVTVMATTETIPAEETATFLGQPKMPFA